MQLTLGMILAGTLGLAMLVSHRKMAVKLSVARNAGNLSARLPIGWVLEAENEPPVMFEIREPASANRPGRVMVIRSERVRAGTNTLQYLKDHSLLHGTAEVLGGEETSPVTIAGVPGKLVQRRREMPVDDADGPAISATVWIAVGVLASGEAVSIELACPMEIDPDADKAIITSTAEDLVVHGQTRN
jgi:hypothetical protein